jgi:hypothetical protein
MMDTAWVDQHLELLSKYFNQVMKSWRLFEPASQFYTKLESGEDQDLEAIAEELAVYLRLEPHPIVTYEWGLKFNPEVAGQIQLKSGLRSHIQIPLFYVGKPEALGAILAHELSHEVIAQEKITCESLDELENLTDLVSLVLGLGKLILNGTIIEVGAQTGEGQSLGYLRPELKVYAYNKVNQQHRVSEQTISSNLTQQALYILKMNNCK